MDIIRVLHKAESKLLKEQARVEKELSGLRTAILALGKRTLLGGKKRRGRKKGTKLPSSTVKKMKAAQRKRRLAERNKKTE